MDRREFLKAAGVMSLSMLFPGVQGWAASTGDDTGDGRKLIVIFLRGAADGLSVVVPYSDSRYYSLRPKIAIPKPGQPLGALPLDNDFGLHPSLAALMPLWQNKTLAFVASSGSPDPTRSHFDAQDYMESGTPGSKLSSTGWMNRLLAQLPDSKSPVRAINVGATLPRILQGPQAVASYSPQQANRTMPLDRPAILRAFGQMYGPRSDSLGKNFRDGIAQRAKLNSELEDEMVAANQGALPARSFKNFGQQVGRLFAKDAKIRLAFVALGGFDTHVNQGASKGQLANHLQTLGSGLSQLVTGLGPAYDKTVILVMSEFGRTVQENGNGGTDHGHGNFMWLLGGPIAGGKIYGRWDGLDQRTLFEGRDLPVTTDFRSVISSVTPEHMCISQSGMQRIFPGYPASDRSLASLLRT